jgi:hypothetical protein
MPMHSSPFTIHFCVSQLGAHEWFRNRPALPRSAASIVSELESVMK